MDSSATSASIVGSVFGFNSAMRRGGALALFAGTTSLAANHFTSNVAGIEGGAAVALGVDVTVSDVSSSFTFNSAPALVVKAQANVSLTGSMMSRNGVDLPTEHDQSHDVGAISCSHARLVMQNIDVYGSTDQLGAPAENIDCDACTGSCASCGVCEGCGRCLVGGCSVNSMSSFCLDRFGSESSCSATTGMCVKAVDPQRDLQLQNDWLKVLSTVAVAGAGTTFVVALFTIIGVIVGSALIIHHIRRNNASISKQMIHHPLQEPLAE